MKTITPTLKGCVLLICTTLFTLSTFSQVNVTEDFETGNFPYALWQDGGDRCSRNVNSVVNGTASVRLNRSGDPRASTYTSNIDLTSYTDVEISFSFRFNGCESGDDFLVQYSNNGGTSYTTIGSYALGGSYSNGTIYSSTITVPDSGATLYDTDSRFRFIADANANNDQFYIDDILISGTAVPYSEINITGNGTTIAAVSYTHLTLPTTSRV